VKPNGQEIASHSSCACADHQHGIVVEKEEKSQQQTENQQQTPEGVRLQLFSIFCNKWVNYDKTLMLVSKASRNVHQAMFLKAF